MALFDIAGNRLNSVSFCDEFKENGFIVIGDHFHPDDIQEFTAAYCALVRAYLKRAGIEDVRRFQDALPALEKAGHAYVAELYDASAQMPEFLRLVSRRSTSEIARMLFGYLCPLYLFTARCRIDPPRDDRRTYGWHRETYYSIPNSKFIQTWFPLIGDTTLENGTIEVCVGSHKDQHVKQSWSEEPGKARQIIVDPTEVAKYEQRAIPMQLGQCMFFDSRLFHRSGTNSSSGVRFSGVGMYHDASCDGFMAPSVAFAWRGQSPQEAFARDQ